MQWVWWFWCVFLMIFCLLRLWLRRCTFGNFYTVSINNITDDIIQWLGLEASRTKLIPPSTSRPDPPHGTTPSSVTAIVGTNVFTVTLVYCRIVPSHFTDSKQARTINWMYSQHLKMRNIWAKIGVWGFSNVPGWTLWGKDVETEGVSGENVTKKDTDTQRIVVGGWMRWRDRKQRSPGNVGLVPCWCKGKVPSGGSCQGYRAQRGPACISARGPGARHVVGPLSETYGGNFYQSGVQRGNKGGKCKPKDMEKKLFWV